MPASVKGALLKKSWVVSWGLSMSCSDDAPLQQFRHNVGRTVLLADIEDGQDVGVVKRGRGTRLLLETTQALGVAAPVGGKNLYSDIAPQSCVAGAVYLAHTASAQR